MLDFAELREFVDLKIKNYSSGMMVRLAFSIMVQADADTMLIDEVLAVGDAAFGQKCMEVFYERRRAGKTIVLVTHDMATVQSMCHRAMVIDDGEVQYIGRSRGRVPTLLPAELRRPPPPGAEGVNPPAHVRQPRPQRPPGQRALLNASGGRIDNVEHGQPISIDVVVELAQDMDHPTFAFHVRAPTGCRRLSSPRSSMGSSRRAARPPRGQIENRLVPGGYALDCWIRRDRETGAMALQSMRLFQFVVYGTAPATAWSRWRRTSSRTLEPLRYR